VGANAAPSSKDEPAPSPSTPIPRTQVPRIASGIPMASNRHVACQRRHDAQDRNDSGRSKASPTPINATITVSSVRCSMAAGFVVGSTSKPCGSGMDPMPKPTRTRTMGADSATRRSRMGRTTASVPRL